MGIIIGKKTTNISDFFSDGRKFKWWAIGISVMATQISAITFIDAPGWAYEQGIEASCFKFKYPDSHVGVKCNIYPIFL